MTEAALEPTGVPASRRGSLPFSFVVEGIWVVLAAGLVLRLILAFLPGFGVDIGLFTYWSEQLAARGPWHFYDQDFFTDYAPGYMYVLFLIGKLDQLVNTLGIREGGFSPATFEYILKIPAIAADLGSAYVLWRLLDGKKPEVRIFAASLYLLLPPVLLIGPIWGQVDSVLAFFLLLSVYYISKDKPIHGAVAFTVGFLVKPQAVAALPILAFWIMKSHPPRWVKPSGGSLAWLAGCLLVAVGAVAAVGFQVAEIPSAARAGALVAIAGALIIVFRLVSDPAGADAGSPTGAFRGIPAIPRLWVQITGICLALLFALIMPFFLLQPWDFIDHMRGSTEVYKVNSFWAFNFWNMFGLFDGGFKADVTGIEIGQGDTYGIENRIWGIGLYVISTLTILVALRKREGAGWLSFGVALSVLAFYMFVTRMHERYMFPVLLPLLAACFLIEGPVRWRVALWSLFGVVMVAHFLNLYHVYMYYNPNSLKVNWIYDIFANGDFLSTGLETVQVLSAVLLASLIALLVYAFAYRRATPDSETS
jgi:Gpi18-like mannosyltransferase